MARWRKTSCIPIWSASAPSAAAPSAPIPKAKPKTNPATMPTFCGSTSCAKTTIAENAEERAIALEYFNMDEFSEQQRPQNCKGDDKTSGRQGRPKNRARAGGPCHALMMRKPSRNPQKNHDPANGKQAEPHGAGLTKRQHDQRGGQRPKGRARVAAHLKTGLSKTKPATRSAANDPAVAGSSTPIATIIIETARE